VRRCRLDPNGLGWGPVAGYCERDNEPRSCMKDGSSWPAKQVSASQKMDSAP